MVLLFGINLLISRCHKSVNGINTYKRRYIGVSVLLLLYYALDFQLSFTCVSIKAGHRVKCVRRI